MENLTDEQLNYEPAIDITIMPGNTKLTIFASGRIDGLSNLVDVVYMVPKADVQLVVLNYIPDLMKDYQPQHERGTLDLGYKVCQCENGGWLMAEYTVFDDKWTRYACPDDEALYTQMRAWTEREIARHRKWSANRVKDGDRPDAFFQANRIAAGTRVDDA